MRIIVLFLLILTFPLSVSANTLINKIVWSKQIKAIKYETNSKFYDIKIWVTNDATSLKDIMLQNNWISWVNGVFECPKDYTRCWWKSYTINERYVEWKKIATYKSTWDRVVFWWDKNIVPLLFQTDKINKDREWEIYEWFANFPLLLEEWKLKTEYYYEAWLIDKKMLSKSSRNFICSDESWENIYFWYIYKVTLDEAWLILKDFWCHNALNLDAGLSRAFIYNMQYLEWPWREILDWVFIVPKNIDFKKQNEEIKNVVNLVMKKLNKFTKERKTIILDRVIAELDNYYNDLFKKQTKAIFEIIDWEAVKVWEETIFESNLIIKKIYIINMLKHYLYEENNNIKDNL